MKKKIKVSSDEMKGKCLICGSTGKAKQLNCIREYPIKIKCLDCKGITEVYPSESH